MNDPVVRLLEKINHRMTEFAKSSSRLASVDRYFLLELGSREVVLHLSNGILVQEENIPRDPDIVITTTEEEIDALLERRSDPMESYSSGRIRIKSSFMDKLLFAELLT